jgi:hypothetical protein
VYGREQHRAAAGGSGAEGGATIKAESASDPATIVHSFFVTDLLLDGLRLEDRRFDDFD